MSQVVELGVALSTAPPVRAEFPTNVLFLAVTEVLQPSPVHVPRIAPPAEAAWFSKNVLLVATTTGAAIAPPLDMPSTPPLATFPENELAVALTEVAEKMAPPNAALFPSNPVPVTVTDPAA